MSENRDFRFFPRFRQRFSIISRFMRPRHERGSNLKYQFQCEKYGKMYKQKSLLKQHMLIHECNINLKYQSECDVCKRKFVSEYYLKQHMLTHECDPNSRWSFQCYVCRKSFTQKGNLKVHILAQHQERCPNSECLFQCEKKYCQKSLLKQHLFTLMSVIQTWDIHSSVLFVKGNLQENIIWSSMSEPINVT